MVTKIAWRTSEAKGCHFIAGLKRVYMNSLTTLSAFTQVSSMYVSEVGKKELLTVGRVVRIDKDSALRIINFTQNIVNYNRKYQFLK